MMKSIRRAEQRIAWVTGARCENIDKEDLPFENAENIDCYSSPVFGRSFATRPQVANFIPMHWDCLFKEDTGRLSHTGGLDGVKHFALWPLEQGAASCFGTINGLTTFRATGVDRI